MVQQAFNSQSLPLNTSQGVVELLKSSENQQAFDQNCETIKAANSGRLPQFFNNVVIFSGLYEELQNQFVLAEKQARLNEERRAAEERKAAAAEAREVTLSKVASAKQGALNAQGQRTKPVMKP